MLHLKFIYNNACIMNNKSNYELNLYNNKSYAYNVKDKNFKINHFFFINIVIVFRSNKTKHIIFIFIIKIKWIIFVYAE